MDLRPHQTPLLLRGSMHRVVLEPASLDFQSRVGRPQAPDAATPCVVILTRSADREADKLSLHLAASGVAMLRVDSDRPESAGLTYDLESGVVASQDGEFRPVVSWTRYFTGESRPENGSRRLDSYVRGQWSPWAAAQAAAGATVVNRHGAPDRVSQLAAARTAGLRVPATVVTSRLREALCLPGDGDVIVKALGEHYVEPRPGLLYGLAPRRVKRDHIARERGVEPAPVLVQEFVASLRELRVFSVGPQLIGFEVTKTSAAAPWTAPERVEVRRVPVPATLRPALRRLTRQWRLDVAAFDVLDTADGFVFLEVNAPCDWLFFEARARSADVSRAVLDLLVRRFRETNNVQRRTT